MGKLKNHMMEVDEFVNSIIDEKTTEEILLSVDQRYGNYWVGYVAEQIVDYKLTDNNV
jgi:hypothetical protein|tara:strand:- start:1096 stop:1269 length:174 start_codon:yes stop_codon:yes gene_type:complete